MEERPACRDVKADGPITSRLPTWLGGRSKDGAYDIEKYAEMTPEQSSVQRFAAPFRKLTAHRQGRAEQVPMDIMKMQDVTMHSSVAGGPPSPETLLKAYGGAKNGVLVKKEVMQGSEVAFDRAWATG